MRDLPPEDVYRCALREDAGRRLNRKRAGKGTEGARCRTSFLRNRDAARPCDTCQSIQSNGSAADTEAVEQSSQYFTVRLQGD